MSEFVFNVPPTAKVIWRWGNGLESPLTDWRSRGSSSGTLCIRQGNKWKITKPTDHKQNFR